MPKPFRSWFGYMFKCFTASSSADILEPGLEWIGFVVPWEGHRDATEYAKHGSAAVGPATASAIPWKRHKPGLRAHVCTPARVSELAPSRPCSAPGPWHSVPAAGAAPPGLNALFWVFQPALSLPDLPSASTVGKAALGEACGCSCGDGTIYVCVPVPPVTPRASDDADEVLDGIPPV